MKNALLRISLPLLLLLPSTFLHASSHPGLKCPTDAKGGKRATIQTTHIRKKLVRQKHATVKQAKVKTPKVHKKINVTLPKVNLPSVHLKLPHFRIRSPFGAHPQSTSFRSKSTARSTF